MLFFTVTRFPVSVHIIDVDASAEKKFRRRGVYAKLKGWLSCIIHQWPLWASSYFYSATTITGATSADKVDWSLKENNKFLESWLWANQQLVKKTVSYSKHLEFNIHNKRF